MFLGRNRSKSPNSGLKSNNFREFPTEAKEENHDSSMQEPNMRMSRLDTRSPRSKSPIRKTSPNNVSRETSASRRTPEPSFKVAFGKTINVDRFDYIASDTTDIDDECFTKKHISVDKRGFNIISGTPKNLNLERQASPLSRKEKSKIPFDIITHQPVEKSQPQS